MSQSWTAHHAQLSTFVLSYRHHRTLIAGLATEAGLPQVTDAARLLDWLQDRSIDPEARNAVLGRILSRARGEGTVGDFWASFLVLSLWPGLSAVRARLRGRVLREDLEGDLPGELLMQIRRWDLSRVRRIAATLLRNVERDLAARYDRDRAIAFGSVPADDAAAGLIAAEPSDVMSLTRTLVAALGRDGALLAAVHLLGLTAKEAGAALGLSHEAARKRLQRLIRRLQENPDLMSQTSARIRLSPVRGALPRDIS